MKIIIAIAALITATLFISCDKDIERTNSCQDIELEMTFRIKVGESACLPDGRSLRILEVRDEFCPCLATCVWEGQLVMKIETEDLNENEVELEIGSTKNVPHGDLFGDIAISDFTYLYNGADDSLPLCTGTYDQDEITVVLTLSEI